MRSLSDREDIMIVITATEDEIERGVIKSEQMLQKVDLKAAETEQTLERIAQEQARQERVMIVQYQNYAAIISASFGIFRNMLRIFGIAMTAVEQAVLTALETTIQAVLTISRAMAKSTMGITTAVQVGLAISSSMMLVVAQATARKEFADVQQRIQATSNILDLASRMRA